MNAGQRLRAPLVALLVAAVLAAPVLLGAPGTAPDHARRQARSEALARLSESGLPRAEIEQLEHRSAIEELAQGYPEDDTATRAGIPYALSLLLLFAGLAAASALTALLDADLALLGARLAAAPPREGAPRLPLEGLAFTETQHLGEAIRLALPAAPSGEADRRQREDTRRQRSQFLASMSHDLRSPLNSILGFAELLLRGADGPLDEAARPSLVAIRATGKRLLRLINQILETARCEAGRMSLERRPTLVAGLLREAVEELRRAHDLPPDVEVEPTLQPGLAPVEVDRVRIAQALALLLGESIGTTTAGVVRLAASERKQGETRLLVFEVDSPGALRAGVPTGFSSAFRVIAPSDLGLAVPLARALVELHGGSLIVDEGPPARFTVALPAAVRRERIGVLRPKRA